MILSTCGALPLWEAGACRLITGVPGLVGLCPAVGPAFRERDINYDDGDDGDDDDCKGDGGGAHQPAARAEAFVNPTPPVNVWCATALGSGGVPPDHRGAGSRKASALLQDLRLESAIVIDGDNDNDDDDDDDGVDAAAADGDAADDGDGDDDDGDRRFVAGLAVGQRPGSPP
jgi:hypothetical protein